MFMPHMCGSRKFCQGGPDVFCCCFVVVVFLSSTYLTEGRTDLSRAAIGFLPRGPIDSRGGSVPDFLK